jgi:carboxymethylenebutenolidase
MLSTRSLESVRLAVDDGTTMTAFVARPAGVANAPGIMVYQDAFGVNEHFKDIALRFAAEGFLAIVPELYHRTGTNVQLAFGDVPAARPHTNDLTVEMTEADVRAAYTWLTANDVAAERVASIGYCLGGRVTYLANARLPLAAAVSYYGGGLHTPQNVALAERQHAPLLMFWAGLDTHIPPENIRVTSEALTAAGKEHTQVVFSQAEHGFFCDERASYHPANARESWALTLEYLRSRGLR